MLSPCLFSLYAEYIRQSARLGESQAGIISITSDTQRITLMTESEGKLKSPSMRVKEESKKAGLKPNILKK